MEIGEVVPEFSLPDQHGVLRSLDELLAGRPAAVFFYPAAMTRGCTAESCHFRDLQAEFDALGASRVGISGDAVEAQSRFSERYALNYPLLSDVDGTVRELFGVRRSFGPLHTRRWTFVLDADRTVLEVVRNELRMDVHADRALARLRALRST